MENYNYLESIKSDILDYIRGNYTAEEIADQLLDIDAFQEELNDKLWIEDSVTGNASGSYTFSTRKAEEYLTHNWDALEEALAEFGLADINTIERGAEWCDVTIRCYLLGQAITEALEELRETHGATVPF